MWMVMSKNERVNSFSFILFFYHVGEKEEREKKACVTTRQSHWVCLLISQDNNNVCSKDFHQKIWFMIMIYQNLSAFFRFINNRPRDRKIFQGQ